MNPLDLTGLSPLMTHTEGIPGIVIGLIDGPVADHPDLTRDSIRTCGDACAFCTDADSTACRHGTFIAGILNSRRGSPAPAICPGCTLLLRPIFLEHEQDKQVVPSAFPVELARAITECVNQGARILNLSIELVEPNNGKDRELTSALDYAASEGVIVIAAAGNQGIIGGSVLTRHPWVIPVAACDLNGRPTAYSNRTGSFTRKGLIAPGEKVTSLASNGHPVRFSGTSVSAPFVTGSAALLWSLFPRMAGSAIRGSLIQHPAMRQPKRYVPPLLNACTAWEIMQRIDCPAPGEPIRMKAA